MTDRALQRRLIFWIGISLLLFTEDKNKPTIWSDQYRCRVGSQLTGSLDGMGTQVIPKVYIVMPVEYKNGNIVLLIIDGDTYAIRITQNESPWKYNHMRTNGVIVDDKVKEFGVSQWFKVRNDKGELVIIPL